MLCGKSFKKTGQISYNLNNIRKIEKRMDAAAENKKKLGYALFIVGIILIAYVLGSVIFIFVGAGDVPIDVFKNNKSDVNDDNTLEGNITDIMEMSMEEMYPMYNLMIWLSFAFLLLFAGYFLCKLGFTVMNPPIQQPKKPSLREVFGGKKHNVAEDNKFENNTYSSVHDDSFEKKH